MAIFKKTAKSKKIFFEKIFFIKNDLEWSKTSKKSKKKIFRKIFDPKKIAIFRQNLMFSAKNGHFETKMAIFLVHQKKF